MGLDRIDPAHATPVSEGRTGPALTGPGRAGWMSGFGAHHETEAVEGALPRGRNSPQRPAFGLYAEQLSGTAFTAPRHENRRSWLYRLRPTAQHGPYRPADARDLRSGPFRDAPAAPNRMRWDPPAWPEAPTSFVEGLTTLVGAGAPAEQSGVAAHLYFATRPMADEVFACADGEMLILPQEGRLLLVTEMGRMELAPGWLGVVPRGVRFRAELPDGRSRGYVAENYGALLRLPELGPIGANGLANPRDFLTPVAAYEDVDRPTRVLQKFGGALWETELDHSPLDVVAWHGNLAPYAYELSRFNTINTVSFDHPDPSIFTVLTSPSDTLGVANLDFVIFPPRWMVADDTFRPPWFHRNVMTEFMGLIEGAYDAKQGGFSPGGASLHPCMSGHGPDQASWEKASAATLQPHRIENTLAFMFESRWTLTPTRWALDTPAMQLDYDDVWRGFEKARLP